MAPLETETSKAGSLHGGSRRTQPGLSHSCDRPASISPAFRAQTISVALASRETTRGTLCSLANRLQPALEQRVAAEQRQRIERVAQ